MATVEGYEFPDHLWYQPAEHLWLSPEAGAEGWVLVTVGLDVLGQEALGDVVYLQLGPAGRPVAPGEAVGTVEAEKMVRPVVAPLAGVLVEVNAALLATPRWINRDPYGQGWLLRIRTREWEGQRGALLHGEAAVSAWVRAELAAYRERG